MEFNIRGLLQIGSIKTIIDKVLVDLKRISFDKVLDRIHLYQNVLDISSLLQTNAGVKEFG